MIKKLAWAAALLLPMAAGAQDVWPAKAITKCAGSPRV